MHFISSLVGVPRTCNQLQEYSHKPDNAIINIRFITHKFQAILRQVLNYHFHGSLMMKILTLMISTSWSTPLSPGKSGCHTQKNNIFRATQEREKNNPLTRSSSFIRIFHTPLGTMHNLIWDNEINARIKPCFILALIPALEEAPPIHSLKTKYQLLLSNEQLRRWALELDSTENICMKCFVLPLPTNECILHIQQLNNVQNLQEYSEW